MNRARILALASGAATMSLVLAAGGAGLWPVLLAVCAAGGIGTVGWVAYTLIEEVLEQAAHNAELAHQPEPIVRFRGVAPRGLEWGGGLPSPASVLAGFEGHLLHRRFVLAAIQLVTHEARGKAGDGLTFFDGETPFQAVVECLSAIQRDGSHEWLITVCDPSALGGGVPDGPCVVTGVVTYAPGRATWNITCGKLYAQDPASIARWVSRAWEVAADGDPCVVRTPELRIGMRWRIEVHVAAPQPQPDARRRLESKLAALLAELRVPVATDVLWGVPAIDGGRLS